MEQSANWITMSDGKQVYLKKWEDPTITPRAVVQISHGMVEHINRYDSFATFLVKQGIVVYGNDHRGHGNTGQKHELMGYFADHQGFEQATDDLLLISKTIRQEYPDIPLLLFGHSMGSFLVRRFIQEHSHLVDGIILSGTGYYPAIVTKAGKLIAKREINKRGRTVPSPLLNKISFGSFNKNIEESFTKFDWLSRDKEEVQKYLDDPLTGFIPTSAFFYDLFTGLRLIHLDSSISKISKKLPFLFLSGDKDPVGNYTIGVKKVMKQYRKHGIEDIDSIFYQDGRHEMLNELNKDQVFQDIVNWIDQKIK